jgi:outer membrane immunogenic protein
MRRIALALLASTSLLGLASVAEAADLAIRKAPPPPPPPIWNWSGFYIGAHVGAGWSRKEFHRANPHCEEFTAFPEYSIDGFTTFGCENANAGSHNAWGGLGGVQAGINWQTGIIVFGIEAQYSWARLKGDHSDSFHFSFFDPWDDSNFFNENATSRFSTDIKGIGTIAGRIGLTSVPSDRTLFYVKGGAAYVKEDFREALAGSSSGCSFDEIEEETFCGSSLFSGEGTASRHRWGWMFGVGLELGLWDNWSAKVEYNYLDFGKDKSVKLSGTFCESFSDGETFCDPFEREHKIDQNIQLIKFGLNYRFGAFGKAPAVMAKY